MSDYADVNGSRVTRGEVVIPYYGVPHADMTMADAAVIPDAQRALTLKLGNLVLSATSYRQASYAASRTVRAVAGANGWPRLLPVKYYQSSTGVSASTVLADAARECGETVQVSSDRIIGTAWTREAAAASITLSTVARNGVNDDGLWYVRPDGTTVVGPRDASPIGSPFDVISFAGAEGRVSVATEALSDWQPGRTFTSSSTGTRTISAVTHRINDGEVRTEVLTMDAGAEGMSRDRLRGPFARAVRALGTRRPLVGIFEYTVAVQDGTTLQLIATEAIGLPNLTAVPMNPSITGDSSTLPIGSKVLVAFVNGDPSRPITLGGDPSNAALTITLAGGGPAVSRVGDALSAGYLLTDSTGLVIAYFPAGAIGHAAANTAAGALMPPGKVVEMTAGEITSGSSKVVSG